MPTIVKRFGKRINHLRLAFYGSDPDNPTYDGTTSRIHDGRTHGGRVSEVVEAAKNGNTPLPAERSYARITGWLYLLLAVAGLFTNNLWHMFNLSGMMTVIHAGIGVTGITVASRGGARMHRFYNVALAVSLTSWGVIGTVSPQWLQPYPLPLENALHTLTGLWGFYGSGSAMFAGRSRRKT